MMSECTCNGDEDVGLHGTFWCQRHKCRKNQTHLKLCRTRPDYRELWDSGKGPGQNLKIERPPCQKEGQQLPSITRQAWNLATSLAAFVSDGLQLVSEEEYKSRLEVCDTCEHRIEKSNRCVLCGCALSIKARGRAWECPDGRWPTDSHVKRLNLAYHVYAPLDDTHWQKNIAELTARWKVFNGRRVIAVATDSKSRSIDEVREEFGKHKAEFFETPNDTRLRETATFIPLLERLESTKRTEATFYAHTKGTSTDGNKRGAETWRNTMYHELLDNIQAVRHNLLSHPCVGTLLIYSPPGSKSPYPTGLKHGNWMYAGTFYWFRHDAIFSRSDWRNIPNDRYGAEAWLAGMIDVKDACTLYQPWPAEEHPAPNPYHALLS